MTSSRSSVSTSIRAEIEARRSATQGPANIISPASAKRREIDLDRRCRRARKTCAGLPIQVAAFGHAEEFRCTDEAAEPELAEATGTDETVRGGYTDRDRQSLR